MPDFPKRCGRCKAIQSADATFCTQCGKRLESPVPPLMDDVVDSGGYNREASNETIAWVVFGVGLTAMVLLGIYWVLHLVLGACKI